jgi:hypothetical protein
MSNSKVVARQSIPVAPLQPPPPWTPSYTPPHNLGCRSWENYEYTLAVAEPHSTISMVSAWVVNLIRTELGPSLEAAERKLKRQGKKPHLEVRIDVATADLITEAFLIKGKPHPKRRAKGSKRARRV